MSAGVSIENTFVREIETGPWNSVTLQIHQLMIGDEGCVVWDAALVLLKYLEMTDLWFQGNHLLEGANVLELGSGTGAVGLTAAAFGASVVLTDLEELLPLLELNVEKNKKSLKGSVKVSCLKWGQDVSEFMKPSVILVADCVYYEQSLAPLVKTLVDLSTKDTTVLFSFEERTDGNKPDLQRQFFKIVQENFSVLEVPLDRLHPDFRSPDIRVVRLQRRNPTL